jgi:hypothetical protein
MRREKTIDYRGREEGWQTTNFVHFRNVSWKSGSGLGCLISVHLCVFVVNLINDCLPPRHRERGGYKEKLKLRRYWKSKRVVETSCADAILQIARPILNMLARVYAENFLGRIFGSAVDQSHDDEFTTIPGREFSSP